MQKWCELCVFSHDELLHRNESENWFQSNYLVIFDNSNEHISSKPDTMWTDSDRKKGENFNHFTLIWSSSNSTLAANK